MPVISQTVSVIIPTLNEAARVPSQLSELATHAGLEVIVVDGGSEDDTLALTRSFAGVSLIQAERGRAKQMNAGARHASGEVLLFLHADVSLPQGFVDAIEWALEDPRNVAGCFRTHTIDPNAPSAKPWLRLADIRSRYTPLPYGDQALFVRRDVFWQVGGFPDQPLMEDLELSRRLRQVGKIVRIPQSVQVSGRRFLNRPIYYTLLVNVFPALYRLGVSPERLAALYGDPR